MGQPIVTVLDNLVHVGGTGRERHTVCGWDDGISGIVNRVIVKTEKGLIGLQPLLAATMLTLTHLLHHLCGVLLKLHHDSFELGPAKPVGVARAVLDLQE